MTDTKVLKVTPVSDNTYLEHCAVNKNNRKVLEILYIAQGYDLEDDECTSRVVLCSEEEIDCLIQKLKKAKRVFNK